jgi:hypothetical protein
MILLLLINEQQHQVGVLYKLYVVYYLCMPYQDTLLFKSLCARYSGVLCSNSSLSLLRFCMYTVLHACVLFYIFKCQTQAVEAVCSVQWL